MMRCLLLNVDESEISRNRGNTDLFLNNVRNITGNVISNVNIASEIEDVLHAVHISDRTTNLPNEVSIG